MNRQLTFMFLICSIFLTASYVYPQNDLDKETVINQILHVYHKQWDTVKTISYDAEYVEKEEKDGQYVEKERFDKKIYVKYLPDTSLIYEDYLAYYKDGEKQDEKKLEEAAKDRKEKKKKRKALDISFSMITPFYPEQKDTYNIDYLGIADENIDAYTCYHFKVTAQMEAPHLINGDYYFDAESFQLVRIDFSPAKLVKKMMFKMKELEMSIQYGPDENNFWYPKQFDVTGKGKAMFFIGVKFAGTEYYRNPQVNINVDDKFEVPDGN